MMTPVGFQGCRFRLLPSSALLLLRWHSHRQASQGTRNCPGNSPGDADSHSQSQSIPFSPSVVSEDHHHHHHHHHHHSAPTALTVSLSTTLVSMVHPPPTPQTEHPSPAPRHHYSTRKTRSSDSIGGVAGKCRLSSRGVLVSHLLSFPFLIYL